MTATRTSENIVLKKDKAMLFCNNFFTQTTNTYHNFPNRSFADNSHQIDLFICCSVKLEKLSVPTRKESSPPIYKLHASRSFQNALGLGQTSNFFMRRTKLSKLSSWKARRQTQLSSSELVWIVQNVLFVCFRGITSEYRLRDKCGSSHATNWTNKLKICLMYINLVREKFITDLIQSIGSTRLKFDVWHNRRS